MTDFSQLTTYFPGDVANNWPSQEPTSQIIRGFNIVVPFISLYEPIEQSLAFVTGTSRCITGFYEIFYTEDSLFKPYVKIAISIASIAGTIFMHPKGMAITTCHDIYLNCDKLVTAWQTSEVDLGIKETCSLVNNLLSLITMVTPSPQLKMASLTIKIMKAAISSKREYTKGQWPETFAHLMMGIIRLGQLLQKSEKI